MSLGVVSKFQNPKPVFPVSSLYSQGGSLPQLCPATQQIRQESIYQPKQAPVFPRTPYRTDGDPSRSQHLVSALPANGLCPARASSLGPFTSSHPQRDGEGQGPQFE